VELSRLGKQKLSEYLTTWLNDYAESNVRSSTYDGYKRNIYKHIIPTLGNVSLRDISAPMLDKLYRHLIGQGYAVNSVKFYHRTLSVALEHAKRYGYIESNPAKNVLTKFSSNVKTPAPYTIEQMRQLLEGVNDAQWAFIIVLGGLYGLRRNEVLGLKWQDVDFQNSQFSIVEQLANSRQRKEGLLTAELKETYSLRKLPITEDTLPLFKLQRDYYAQMKDKEGFHDLGFVICKDNGNPLTEGHISRDFNKIVSRLNMPHLRFHDLRHSAATNMHQLTGDFYTVGEILGHSLKGIGNSLGFSNNMASVTERYVDVRLERKQFVLDKYHSEVRMKKFNERDR
jgi:integrase